MSSCPYKSFTTDLAYTLNVLASAMSNVAGAMELCHELPTLFPPPPIDTATSAAEKADPAAAIDIPTFTPLPPIDTATPTAEKVAAAAAMDIPTFTPPPPIDTATPAAAKAAAAMVADAMVEDDDKEEAASAEVERELEKLHTERLRLKKKIRCDLNKCWNGGWTTVQQETYQIYRYQLYHYDKKEHCINHYGHYNPVDNTVTPGMLVPDFKGAPKGYSARSALY